MISFIVQDLGIDRIPIALKALPSEGICYTNLSLLPKGRSEGLEMQTVNTLSEMLACMLEQDSSFLLDLSYIAMSDNIVSQLELFLMLADFIEVPVVIIGLPIHEDFLEGMVSVSEGGFDDRSDGLDEEEIDYDLWPLLYFDLAVEKCHQYLLETNVNDLIKKLDIELSGREKFDAEQPNKAFPSEFLLPIQARIRRTPKVAEMILDEEPETQEEIPKPEPKKTKRLAKKPAKEAQDA